MLCKACRQKAGLTRSALAEQRAAINLFIALGTAPMLDDSNRPHGFENSSQYAAIKQLIEKAD